MTVPSTRNAAKIQHNYATGQWVRDGGYVHWGDDEDGSIQSSDSKAIATGAWDFTDAALTLALPAIRVDSDTILISDFDTAVGLNASDAIQAITIASNITIPADSIVLGVKVDVTTGFTDDTTNLDSVGMSIGPLWNSDAWSGVTSDLNVYQSDENVGASAQAGPGSYVESDAKCYVNLNYSGGVQSDMNATAGQGEAIVRVYYTRLA